MPKPKHCNTVLHWSNRASHVLKTWWFSPVNIDWNYIKLPLESLEIINIWIVIKNKICSTVQVFSHSLFLSICPSWYQTVPFLNIIFSPVLLPDHFQMILFFCCFLLNHLTLTSEFKHKKAPNSEGGHNAVSTELNLKCYLLALCY